MSKRYDAVVVGGRCGGAATAFLLAREGFRVLVVEQAEFPSDTLSTHFLQPPGVLRLAHWGLLPDIAATGAPPIKTMRLIRQGISIAGHLTTNSGEAAPAYCVRRQVLDTLLLTKAAEAGAEVRQRCRMIALEYDGDRVTAVRTRSGGTEAIDRTSVVIGADGMRSVVARSVGSRPYHATKALTCTYYSYWADFPTDSAELCSVAGIGVGIYPTNDGLTCIAVARPYDEFAAFRADIEGGVQRALAACGGDFGARLEQARRVERFRGTRDVPNFFRTCQGPGWALVGDAGHHKDPITGQGMADAFADAELLAACATEELAGAGWFDGTSRYQSCRDATACEQHRLTCRIAALSPVPGNLVPFHEAVAADSVLSDCSVRVAAGLCSLADFSRMCWEHGVLLPTRHPQAPQRRTAVFRRPGT